MFTRLYYKGLFATQVESNYSGYSFSFRDHLGKTVTNSASMTQYCTYLYTARKTPCKKEKNASNLVGSNYGCFAFGDGDTPPTIDDYQLSGNHFTTYEVTVANQLNPESNSSVSTYTITNTGTSAFTIKEIGLFATAYSSGSQLGLIFREVLDTPVTIEAGGVGQVVLTLGVAIPT